MNPYLRINTTSDDYIAASIYYGLDGEEAIHYLLERWIQSLAGKSPFDIKHKTLGNMTSVGVPFPLIKKKDVAVIKFNYPTWDISDKVEFQLIRNDARFRGGFGEAYRQLTAVQRYKVDAYRKIYHDDSWIPFVSMKPGWVEVENFINEKAIEALILLFEQYETKDVIPEGEPTFYNFINQDTLDLWLRFWTPKVKEINNEAHNSLIRAFKLDRFEGNEKVILMHRLGGLIKNCVSWAGLHVESDITAINSNKITEYLGS